MIEQGMFLKWKKRYWPKTKRCEPPDKAEPMQLDALHGVFYLLFAITGFAFGVLVLEIIFHNLCTKKTILSIEVIVTIIAHMHKVFIHQPRALWALYFKAYRKFKSY